MYKEIFNIYKSPQTLSTQGSLSQHLVLIFKIYFVIIITIVFSTPLLLLIDYLIKNQLHFNSIVHKDKDSLKLMFNHYGRTRGLLFGCLFAPIVEELLFRLPLSLNRRDICLWLSIILFMFINPKLITIEINLHFTIRLTICVVFFCSIYKVITQKSLDRFRAYQKYFILLSVVVFGLVHIGNYTPLQWPIVYLYPFFVIPQLIMGCGLSYTRLKTGVAGSILVHCMINSISFFLSNF
jgi:hypothetical protein